MKTTRDGSAVQLSGVTDLAQVRAKMKAFEALYDREAGLMAMGSFVCDGDVLYVRSDKPARIERGKLIVQVSQSISFKIPADSLPSFLITIMPADQIAPHPNTSTSIFEDVE